MKANVDLGFLTADEFITRRSSTLINNTKAKLIESFEVESYLQRLEPKYHSEIDELAQIGTKPLANDVREIVTIIAYHEGSRIRQTLNNYVTQDIDPKLYEIIILDNHPCDQDRDDTYIEIENFVRDNPDITITYVHKIWKKDELATVGNARKYVFDIALARLCQRGSNIKDTILISNDADTVELKANYLSSILGEFDSNKEVDALVTLAVVPTSTFRKPNLFAILSLWDSLDEVALEGEPYTLRGCSTAYKASIYAAVGGFNPKAIQAEDLETGFMIADARGWNPKSIIQLTATKQIIDPRRILEAAASRIPVNEMHYKFESRPEVRNANNDQLLALIPDELDWEMLQEDVDSFWAARVTGMYKWRGQRYPSDYKKAMKKVGIEYEIQNGRIKILSVDGLLQNYINVFERPVKIVHSKSRKLDPKRIEDIHRYFSTVTDSAIECRKRVANEIAKKIEDTKSQSNANLDYLLQQYKRFAGQDYCQ